MLNVERGLGWVGLDWSAGGRGYLSIYLSTVSTAGAMNMLVLGYGGIWYGIFGMVVLIWRYWVRKENAA